MKTWIVAGLILLVTAVVFMIMGTRTEHFTVDFNAARAQRQQLQFEGERRYNDFARLQSPDARLDPDRVNAAFQQAIPVPTTTSSSLMSLLSATNFGAADDGRNKQGLGVEQTGMVQNKINFCEGITEVNCDLLDDPRLAECGFCHRDGKNSKGKAHRGGMFISADDQLRANEGAGGKGGKGVYKPTFGTCQPQNFTLMKTSCQVRELQMQCQKVGGPSASNPCGQCFGSAPAGSTGLLYVGPKERVYTAILHVSHSGGHGGLAVTYPNGYTIPLVSTTPTKDPVLEPAYITLNIQEGQTLTITVQGVPSVWCGWLSNQEGTRTVSLDVGVQKITPENRFTIAGDKFSSTVATAMARSPGWTEFQKTVPNSVLWYQRREGNGMITAAWYGNSANTTDSSRGVDVTDYVKQAAAADMDIPVTNQYFRNDPDPNIPKNLYITRDNGNTLITPEGQVVRKTNIVNTMVLDMIVPATLVDPLFQEDKYYCPSGPLVFTEIGAGVMGANSCFTADGKFNPSLVCIQRLFQAAGGSPNGTMYPKTKEAAAALAQKDPATNEISLDATMNYFNTLGNVAVYGVDATGAPKEFETVRAAALQMLGVTMNNPCDGPTAKTGPHNPECLDYLWRTSGDPSKDSLQMDPAKLGYAYCTKEGKAAPLNPDGSVNQAAAAAANEKGAIPNIRAYFQGFFNRSQDSSSFDAQAAAMRSCYGVMMSPPVEDPAACPRSNPDEWQCIGPNQLQQPEVFHVGSAYTTTRSDAEAVCATYGARVATTDELATAQRQGADWCATGWVSDSTDAKYPITTSTQQGCGNGSAGVKTWTPSNNLADVNCVGKKPPAGTQNIAPFNGAQWYNPNSLPVGISDSSIIIGAEMQNVALCGGPTNGECAVFKSDTECKDFLKNKPIAAGTNIAPLNPGLSDRMKQYFSGQV